MRVTGNNKLLRIEKSQKMSVVSEPVCRDSDFISHVIDVRTNFPTSTDTPRNGAMFLYFFPNLIVFIVLNVYLLEKINFKKRHFKRKLLFLISVH